MPISTMRKSLATLLSAAAIATVTANIAFAQDYPVKPIHMLTNSSGGSSDFVARLVAQGISGPLGQQVVMENRSGATIAGDIASKSPADGYTLVYWGSTFWTLPLMRKNMPYDTLRDFVPVVMTVTEPLILVVHPSLPVKSARDLIALAKARPCALNYASGGTGSSNHLAAELFKSMAGIKVVGVQYKGSGAGLIGLMSGQVQVMFTATAAVMPHTKSGRLRALAVTTAQPSELVPGLPTVAATGLPGYETSQKAGIFAPIKTPAAIVNRLNREVVQFLDKPEVKKQLLNQGVEVVASTPEEFATRIRSEVARMDKVIREADIHAD